MYKRQPFLIIAVDNVMIIAMNAVLQHYGGAELGDRLITCATIAQSFMLVVTMPLGGISAGTQTILAFNYGARNRERIVQAQKYIVLMCAAYVTVLFILARLAGPLFVRLFTADAGLAAEAFDAIKVCTLDVYKRQEAVRAAMPRDREDIRIFNQALMELGATVCAPAGEPACMLCPAADLCLGRRRGTAAQLPVKAAKKPRRVEDKTVFLLLRQGRAALRKRPAEGLLAGLWEFPNVEGALDEAAAGAAVRSWGLTARTWRSRLNAKHVFTHVEWRMTGYVLEVAGEGPPEWTWADAAALGERAVPSAFELSLIHI